ncbi:MAG: hypothetical protein ABI217_08745 [Chthoniobacterales bacterium]
MRMAARKPAWLRRNPGRKLRDFGMRAQFFHGVEFALELVFRKQLMDLRVTGSAKASNRADGAARKIALVAFVVMTGARDERMAGELFFPVANRTASLHR